MRSPLESKYISRSDAAKVLMVSVHSVLRMEKQNRIPLEVVKFDDYKSIRKLWGYNRQDFIDWATTNPIKHPGYKCEETRKARMTGQKLSHSHGDEKDVYNIQKKAAPFVYSGLAADIILFCRNGLL